MQQKGRMMSNYYNFSEEKNSKKINTGFQYGLIGGVILVIFHLVLLLIFGGTNAGDLIAMFAAWFVYYFIGHQAAQKQYEKQREELNPIRGVKAAGTGAALVTSLLVWLYIIIRGVFRDALGIYILVNPAGMYCAVIADVLVALGIGTWAGNRVVKRYQIQVDY